LFSYGCSGFKHIILHNILLNFGQIGSKICVSILLVVVVGGLAFGFQVVLVAA
jgi:hypothetical protein